MKALNMLFDTLRIYTNKNTVMTTDQRQELLALINTAANLNPVSKPNKYYKVMKSFSDKFKQYGGDVEALNAAIDEITPQGKAKAQIDAAVSKIKEKYIK